MSEQESTIIGGLIMRHTAIEETVAECMNCNFKSAVVDFENSNEYKYLVCPKCSSKAIEGKRRPIKEEEGNE